MGGGALCCVGPQVVRDDTEAAAFFGAVEDHDHHRRAVNLAQSVGELFVATRKTLHDDEVSLRRYWRDEGEVWEGFAEE